MPKGGDWCFTAAYLLGGEYAARLFNLFMLVAAAGLLFLVVRRWLSAGAAMLMTALFAATPLVQLVTGSLFVENLWAAVLLGSLVALERFRDNGRKRYLYLCVFLAGTGMAVKFGSLAFVAVMIPLVIWEVIRFRKRERRPVLFTAAGLLALFLVAAAPPYVTAFWMTGNPLFPFQNAVFQSPYIDATTSIVDSRWHTPLGFSTLFDVTFASHRFMEGQDGSFGFHWLLLLPLSVLLLRRDWPYLGRTALAASLLFSILTFATTSYLRYLYPALPLFMIAIAAAFSRMRTLDGALYRTGLGLAVAAVLLNVYFLPSSGWYHKDFYLNTLFRPEEARHYIRASAPERELVEYLNLRYPHEPVCFLQTNKIAGLLGMAVTNTWHTDSFAHRIRSLKTYEEFAQLFRDFGIRSFIMPADESGAAINPPELHSFLSAHAEREFRAGGFQAVRLKPEAIAVPAPAN